MGECENLESCSFYRKYENDESVGQTLRRFINYYCKGSGRNVCVRKKVRKALGGPEHVPLNMKPNGQPVVSTSDLEWPDRVKIIVSMKI